MSSCPTCRTSACTIDPKDLRNQIFTIPVPKNGSVNITISDNPPPDSVSIAPSKRSLLITAAMMLAGTILTVTSCAGIAKHQALSHKQPAQYLALFSAGALLTVAAVIHRL